MLRRAGRVGRARCRPWRSSRSSTSAAPASSCCSRCSTSTARCSGSRAAGPPTGEPWTYDAERYARVSRGARPRAGAHARLRAHRRRAGWPSSRSRSTTTRAAACGRCDRCAGPWFATAIPEAAVDTARGRLERPGVELEPRAQWPTGMDRLGVPAQGQDRARRVAMADGPRRGPPHRPRLGPAAARAAARRRPPGAARARCGPASRCCATGAGRSGRSPSSRCRPAAARSSCSRWPRGLAEIGPAAVPRRARPRRRRPVGEPGGNSAFRLAGVWGRLAVGPELAAALQRLRGPGAARRRRRDSRWTLTVAAQALRQAGVEAVLPFALALEG